MADESQSRYEEFAEEIAERPESVETMEPSTLERLGEQFGEEIHSTSTRLGEATAIVDASSIVEIMTWLRDERNFVLLSDLTAHDCHGEDPRFWVVYHLTNVEVPERLRIKVGLPEKKPVVESVVPVWLGANFYEREVYDLFGVEFKNHPNLTRIMMPEEWEGHPLRKDFPIVYEPVMFTHNADEVKAQKPFARE
ncbi:MAG: NADH-quinone oxidoreductase subunit C [Chloroflexota bacterium]|nr:NADH-quinone oxidoreductase subunit C [Chloroflexota bacterium]